MPGFNCAPCEWRQGMLDLATIPAGSAEGAASAVPMAAPAPSGGRGG